MHDDDAEHAGQRAAPVAHREIVRREPIGFAQDVRPGRRVAESGARRRLDEFVPLRSGVVDSLELHAIHEDFSRITSSP